VMQATSNTAIGMGAPPAAPPNAAINLAASGAGGVTGVLPPANGGAMTLAACAAATTITAPCTVYQSGVVSASSLTGYATVFTISVQGVYVISCNIYATTASSTSFVINLDYSTGLLNSTAFTGACASSTIGITANPALANSTYTGIFAAGRSIQIGTYASSGSNTGGAWNYAVTIERLQ